MIDLNKILQHFPCDDCSLVFSDYKQFLSHRNHHTSLFQSTITEETLLEGSCPFCFLSYLEKFSDKCLEEFMGLRRTVVQGEKPNQIMRCKYYPKCNEEFYDFFTLVKHSKKIHRDDRPYACQQCNYASERYDNLKRHLFVHMDRKRFECQLCPKVYTSKVALNIHLISSHKVANIKSHECSYCDKIFFTLSKLKRHLILHVRTPSKCHICYKEFYYPSNLKSHIRSHDKIFKCNLCPKEYNVRSSLRHHLMRHRRGNIKSHECTLCGEDYDELEDLKKHLIMHFPTPQTTKCHLCSKELYSKPRLKDHLKRHYKMFKCHLCSKRYGARVNLNSHLLSVHSEVSIRSYDCSYCDKKFPSQSKLKPHLRRHLHSTRGTYRCQICPTKFASQSHLNDHLRKHTEMFKCHLCPEEYAAMDGLKSHLILNHKKVDVNSHVCSYCGKKCISPSKLKRHLQVHFSSSGTPKCHMCSKEFASPSALEEHFKSHERTFKCHLCPDVFPTKMDLKRHFLSSHKEVNMKSQKCSHCAKIFFTPSELKRHSVMHLPTRFKCDLCPKEYARELSLKRHLISHEKVNEESHNCDYCGQNYTQLSDLKTHLRVHFPTPETTECHLCSKEFSCQRNLKDHLKSHYKMYKCHLCDKEYSSKVGLSIHFLSRHKEVDVRSFDCTCCDKKFPTPSKLKTHLRTHFPSESSETFKCHICAKELSSKYILKAHIEKHNGPPPKRLDIDRKWYNCNECGQQFALNESLKKHLDPEKESKNTLCCKKCPKTFKNLNCFTYHKRSHTGFKCEICKKTCYTPKGFKMHLKGHEIPPGINAHSEAEENVSSEKLLNVPKIPELQNHSLKREERKPKPNVCENCGKRFTCKTLLKEHLSPERETKNPLRCKECSGTFSNINCFKHHKRSHVEGFWCKLCETKCITRDGFRRHLAKHEKIISAS